MDINKVEKFEEKYLELLKQIDCGEYLLTKKDKNYDGFRKWIGRYVFEDKNNYGIISAFDFNGSLRIQLAFKHDVEKSVIDIVEQYIKQITNIGDCEHTYVWCTNYNLCLVNSLKDRLPIEKGIYMSYEFTFYKNVIKKGIDITPLIVKPYCEDILDNILVLLEGSFRRIAQKGEIINNRDFFLKKFKPKEKSRCEVFYLDDILIGFYYHNDAEIEYIAIAEGYQSNGYGSKILLRCLNKISEDSKRLPHLYCINENQDAYRFYLREGGVVTAKSARFHIINKV